jgi:hypothetical protein
MSPESGSTIGLSLTPFSSISSIEREKSRASSSTPIT